MGCWTAYLVRLEDGSAWELDEKYGRWRLTGANDRAGLVERALADGRPVDEPKTARSCQGIALDLATRRYRFYSCALNMPSAGVSHRESMALRQAATPGWENWDVAYAWGGDEELLTIRHDELIADVFARATCLVSVIADDATLTHWQLSNTIVPLLAHHGESLPGTLAASAPFPLAAEDAVTDGVVIDLRARRLRYWTTDTASPGLIARMEATWPGWNVERLPWGHLGHLAATGQPPTA
ncbi:hypothetical protein ACIBI3_06385 [Actinomadura luteofluorescens]|uniref:hypothetical protein n=1 Tax=Actinomadura luteofluorescens TaxID=46163 RepID=UPI003489B6C2